MAIKHSNWQLSSLSLKLAAGCLLATSLLTACGGGSSSSSGAGAGSGGSYDLGYAQGTAATLERIVDDLKNLQTSLAGSGAPVQISSGLVVNLNSLNLEPRQRADLAARLAAFIAEVEAAQMAAAAAGAGQAEAATALTAAEAALQALQLVVAADTAAQAGAGDGAEQAAITALTNIAEVDLAESSARATINQALTMALQAQVADLEQQLAAAQAALGTTEGDQNTIATLTQQLTQARTAQAAAQASLNARTERFGAPSALNPASQTPPTVGATYHPRREGVQVWFDSTFDPTGSWSVATAYTFSNRGTAPTDGFDLSPDAVRFNSAGSNPQVFTASSPNTARFPGRGTVYRGALRFLNDDDSDLSNNNGRKWLYALEDRLVVQGEDPEPRADAKGGDTATNAGSWNNWDAEASVTFQYKANDGFTMGFGGEGVIFSDLERYTAKGGKDGVGSGCTPAGTGGEYCDEPGTANVELSFGTPQPDRYGEPHTHFWYVRAQSPRLPGVDSAVDAANAITPDLTVPGDQIDGHEMGRYEMILSAHAGENRRLSYAAYGLFKFIDFTIASQRVGRMQTFHYGLDAFADIDGRRTTDLAAEDAIEGTFKGKTTAYVVTSDTKTIQPGRLHAIKNTYRARGDIELRACIGGSGNCSLMSYTPGSVRLPGASADGPIALQANQVAGKIDNLEYAYQNNPGHWTKDNGGGISGARGVFLGNDQNNPPYVELQPVAIGADGTYEGGVANPRFMAGARMGTYEGAFYGPAGRGMEAAGTWQLNMATWEGGHMDAIIGSFGATCEGTCKAAPPSQ